MEVVSIKKKYKRTERVRGMEAGDEERIANEKEQERKNTGGGGVVRISVVTIAPLSISACARSANESRCDVCDGVYDVCDVCDVVRESGGVEGGSDCARGECAFGGSAPLGELVLRNVINYVILRKGYDAILGIDVHIFNVFKLYLFFHVSSTAPSFCGPLLILPAFLLLLNC